MCCLPAINARAQEFTQVADTKLSLSVRAKKNRNGDVILLCVLRNRGARSVSFFDGQLPWNSNAFIVHIVTLNGAADRDLPRVWTTDGPNGLIRSKSLLKRHGTIVGEFNVSAYFAELNNALKQDSVVIFWAWQPSTFELKDRVFHVYTSERWLTGSVFCRKNQTGPDTSQ